MKNYLKFKAEIKGIDSKGDESENTNDDLSEENEITEMLPHLYSKRVITAFSIIFSPIFGAVILMSNLKQKGEKKGKMQVLLFALIYTVGTIISVNSISSTKLTLPLNILGAIILTEYFWNRYLGKNIKFEKKSWIKPALISIAVVIPFIIALFYSG